MKRFSRDALANVNPRRVGNGAMSVITALQDFQPHEQVGALCTVFKLAMEKYEFNMVDSMTVVNNVIHDVESKRPEFKAVAQYMEEEWR